MEAASCGRVVTNGGPYGSDYDGATKKTNNTAELTALLRAVQQELERDDGSALEICVDSMYAINMATGKWTVRKNGELVRRLQRALSELRRRRRVRLSHVRSHTNVAGNEVADVLAKLAADEDFDDDVLGRARMEYDRMVGESGPPDDDAGINPTPPTRAAPPQPLHAMPVRAHSLADG